MNSLSSGQVADVLQRLHKQADPSNGYLSMPLPFDPSRGNELTVKVR